MIVVLVNKVMVGAEVGINSQVEMYIVRTINENGIMRVGDDGND